MKKLVLIILCLVVKATYAQIIVDKNIDRAYNKVVRQLLVNDRKFISSVEFEKTFSGVQIFTKYNMDTLNKKDRIIRHGTIIIRDVDPVTGKISEPDTLDSFKNENIYNAIPYSAVLINDTLLLQVPDFQANLVYKVFKRKVKSTFEEYDKSDTIFRLNLSQPKRNQLSITVKTTEFKLSSLNFKQGQIIYGEVEFASDPYYVDDADFTSGYIKKRLRGKFMFRAKVVIATKH